MIMLAQVPDPTLQAGGSAGYLALLLVVVLFIATGLLVRNMSGRLDRLPEQFPGTGEPTAGTTAAAPDGMRRAGGGKS